MRHAPKPSSPLRFSAKVVIVTGSSRGIGRATALEAAREGAALVLNARGAEELEAARRDVAGSGAEVLAVGGDVRGPAFPDHLVELTLERFGRIDALVNNVGGGSAMRDVDQLPDSEWERDLETNLTSAFRLCRAVVPVMKRQRYGRIVNVSSVAGRSRGHLSGTAYSAAKAGLLGLTRHMAWDLGGQGITVNALAPGLTETERALGKWQQRSSAQREKLLEGVALRRFASPEEVARSILFLASDDASYVTGVTLDVNGGLLMA